MSGFRLAQTSLGILILVRLFGPCLAEADSSPRERIMLDDRWHFIKGDPAGIGDELSYPRLKPWIVATGVEFTTHPPAARPPGNPGADVAWTQSGFDDRGWQPVNLPHDWAIAGPFEQKYDGETAKLKYWGPVWYRKHFDIPAADSGREIFLDIDGAMSYSEVWLNGRFVGGWPYGYASFELDLTPFIQFGGENVLVIRLDTPPEASRWYPGAGIDRNVWFVKTGPVHVGHWGTFVTTPKVTPSAATVNVQVNVVNDTGAPVTVSVKNEIYELKSDGRRGESVASLTSGGLNLAADNTTPNISQIVVKRPRLWSLEQPQRYVVVTSIDRDGKLLDRYETPFGIRTIQFTATNGFLLNGQRVNIHGVCLHGDLGPLGTAFNLRARQRQLGLLREMGCNAIRTSHNPPEPELLDLCDRMGFLVMDEAFDCWALAKRAGDYHLLFPDWHEKDLRAFIRRDRNHPCVILWSMGNEVYEQHNADGWKLGQPLAGIVHEEDATRPVTMALHTVAASTNGFQKVVDVFGFNYKPFDYAEFRTHNPDLPLIGSETVSCVSSRGEYFFPVSTNQKSGRADFQVTSYDLAAPAWGYPPDEEFMAQVRNPFVAGEFVWSGFDYLGEPTPYDHDTTNRLLFTDPAVQAQWDAVLKAGGKIAVPSRSSYFGIFDLCGFKKDRFFLYQSRWRPDFPMAHLVPQNWNWPDRLGKITPVQVYTSGDEAELFLNGKSLGRKEMGQYEYRLRWDSVVYEPGTLKVVTFKNGKKWAMDTVQTTGPAARLTLGADRLRIRADGKDLSFVTLTVEDRNGLTVPQADNPIRFSIEGPGEIVATGNGDPTSHASFQAKGRNAFNGLGLVIVRAKSGESGKIMLRAQSEGLTGATVTIRSLNRW
ncbi:MAG TPA: beta-galactosidase GalB [Verrucomicrobiae bacterium]|nr:beta-galactosidase GalB [Verrucomicrobiae bacterium]